MDLNILAEKTINRIREEAERAERNFDRASEEIQRKASGRIDLFGGTATRDVVSIASDVRYACDTLYSSLQTLIIRLDEEMRPLLPQGLSAKNIKEVTKLIKWLNEESEIENNFTASFNNQDLGHVASGKYIPSIENRMRESYWEDRYNSTPEAEEEKRRRAEQEALQQKRLEEKKQREKLEKQKAQEEEKRKQEQFEQNKKRAMENWQSVKNEADGLFAAYKQALKEDFANKKQILRKDVQNAILDLQNEKDAAEKTLASLGIFKFSEKKRLREKIEKLEENIGKLSSGSYMESALANRKNTMEVYLNSYRKKLDEYMKARFPYEKLKELEKTKRREFFLQSFEGQKALVFETIERLGKCREDEITEALPEIQKARIGAIIRQLSITNKIFFTEYKYKLYYETCVKSIPEQKVYKSKLHEYMEDEETAKLPLPEIPEIK